MILKEQQEKKVYSDGEAIEQRILKIAQKYPEDLSQDYIADCSEYTINNTFSAVRENILNWYPFREHASILEVGAGMGAITGMLCARADNVTAIEMSAARADVIRARYSSRSNLKVISENINEWNSEERFDYIVFIGVLEYAAVFSDNQRPYDEFLLSVKHLLKDDGILLFAIENRFGLKYWLGASEDHLQTPFAGIEGYKKAKTAKTFSRKELENILDRVGLKNHRFYSVLPDYKFPELIFTDEYVPNHMNLKKVSFTYSKNSSLVADERDLYKDVIENNVFSFFANSFLIEASTKNLDNRHVIHVSAKGEVYKDFRVNTVMDSEDRVYKIPMHKNAEVHIDNIVENTRYLSERGVPILEVYRENELIYCKKHDGIIAQVFFQEALADNQIETIYRLIDVLKSCFLKSSKIVEYNINNIIVKNKLHDDGINYGLILQKAFIDMTFYNAFWEDGQLIFFDQEWCFERVPLNFCLYYAVKSAYLRADANTDIALEDLFKYVGIKEEEVAAYNRLEDYMWSNVFYRQTDFYGADGYCNRYSAELTLTEQNKRQDAYCEELESERTELNNKNLDLENINLDLESKNLDLEGRNLDLENRNLDLENRNLDLESRNLDLESRNLDLEKINSDNTQKKLELLEVQRHYEAILNSKSWKMVNRVCKTYDKVFHKNGESSAMFYFIKKYLEAFNIINIKFVCNAFRIGGMKQVIKEMRGFRQRISIGVQPEIPQLFHVEETNDITHYNKLNFKKYDNPQVTIIIPVYNQFIYTYNCLKAILENSGDVPYEIIIADDASDDLTTRLLDITENISILRNDKNQMFLKNCNNAAKYANGKYILFLNNDTQVQKDWLAPLIGLIESNDLIGMVGSKLIYPDGTLQEAGGIVWGDGHAWNYGNGQNANEPQFNYVKEVDYISGASIMIRASLWKEIGGFDERFAPAYYEDTDLAFEVRKRGFRLMYQPLSVVVHFEGKSNGTDIDVGIKRYQVENAEKFIDKWKDELKQQSNTEDDLFHARDRSQSKKAILVVDHYVPQYDKDAGGKCTYMYLKMFVRMGLKVIFIGDNFYKSEPYTTELSQLGIEVLYGNYYYNNWQSWLEDNGKYFDYIYLQRPHISIKYIDIVKKYSNAKIFYFAHDLHHLRESRQYELTGDEKILKSSEKWKIIEYELFEKADVGHVVGSFEQKLMQDAFPDTPIRNIPLYIYENVLSDINKDFSTRNDIIYVGGFGHPPNIDAVLWFANNIFPRIVKEIPDIKWHIVGSKPPKEVSDLSDENILVEGFVSDARLAQMYRKCRMAVVPLRVGAGVKGKVVEAAYYQIPLVTTPVGAEGISLEENAFEVVECNESMAEKIVKLYNDFDRLREMSDNSVLLIKNHYTVDAAYEVLKIDMK